MIDILMKNQLFREVSEKKLAEIIDSSHYKLREYKQDEIIAISGDEVVHLYILLSGSVRAEMASPSGKVIRIDDIKQGEDLAIGFVFSEHNKYPVTVIANQNTKLIGFSRESLLKMMQQNSTIMANFLRAISDKVDFMTRKVRFLHFPSIKGKLAKYFLEYETDNFRLNQTHEQLSTFFGVSRPSLSRAISELKKEGAINVSGKNVQILDFMKLKKYLRSSLRL